MDTHQDRVARISQNIKAFYDQGRQYRIYHGTTNTTRKTSLTRSNVIDTSQMDHVLSIDPVQRTAQVEPNVSMEALVDATLPHGLVAQVVMEFPRITVGGGFAGTAGESSSFKYGLFDRTISQIEIVLPDGEVVMASEREREDLFQAAAGSFGTFGIITMLEVRLIAAQPFVKTTFGHVGSMEEALQQIEHLTNTGGIDFLEGIMFGQDRGLVISGEMSDGSADTKLPRQTYTRPSDPWFYLRAEEVLKREIGDHQELIPLKDYLFRYDRGIFWGGKYAFRYFLTPFNSLTRWVLDYFMHTEVAYRALHHSHMADQFIVQDICFPYKTVTEFVGYLHRTVGFYPLWLCPLKMHREMALRPKRMPAFDAGARSPGMMLNIGLWGPGPTRYEKFIATNRDIERRTTELGGLKCFYAQAFYTQDEFWQIYDKAWYDRLRTSYRASGLPSVYQKVNVDLSTRKARSEQGWGEWLYESFKEQWPVRGVYGVLRTLLHREYLLMK